MRAFGPMISLTTWVGGQLAGREPTPEDVEPLTWALWEHAQTQGTIKYLAAESRLEGAARSIVEALAQWDVVLTPALAGRPVPVGEMTGFGSDPMSDFRKSGYFTPFTAIVNVIGEPAISLPLYQGEDGLPTAVQLIGPPAREEVLLSLARQLEAALPWADRRPALSARGRGSTGPQCTLFRCGQPSAQNIGHRLHRPCALSGVLLGFFGGCRLRAA